MTVFALYPYKKSVLEFGSFGQVELDDQLAQDLNNFSTEEDVIFGNFGSVEAALNYCVWINCGKWVFK